MEDGKPCDADLHAQLLDGHDDAEEIVGIRTRLLAAGYDPSIVDQLWPDPRRQAARPAVPSRNFACVAAVSDRSHRVLVRGPGLCGDGIISSAKLKKVAGEPLKAGWYELTDKGATYVGEELSDEDGATGGSGA